MPNKRKICNDNINSNQMIYIESLNSYYHTESVLNSAYRKVLDFKENAEKILEKEKLETLNLDDFAKAILDSRSFEVSLQHNYIKLKCYITLEKDKNCKKKHTDGQSQVNQSPPDTPLSCSFSTPSHIRTESYSSDSLSFIDQFSGLSIQDQDKNNTGGAKKVNVEVIMKTNPFKIEENEKTTRMELIKSENSSSKMLRFSYYVKSECEKFKENNTDSLNETSSKRLVLFTNDFFTIYQNKLSGEVNISLNEIVQSKEEIIRTEALGEKLFLLLKERPRHRALLTNECKINQSYNLNLLNESQMNQTLTNQTSFSLGSSVNIATNNQEDETYYTRELINIYGQPIVPSFHKHFNYQLSNTHYGYRTLRRLLNCDILKKYVKITKEEIKSLERVVEFVQLTEDKCLLAFQLNLTNFYDPLRFENGIVKNWLDIWYVERLKEKYSFNSASTSNQDHLLSSSSSASFSSFITTPPPSASSLTTTFGSTTSLFSLNHSNSWSFFNTKINDSNNNLINTPEDDDSECDKANHLWFCLKDYSCLKMEHFISKLSDYITVKCNKSNLILIQTAYPLFEYKTLLSETRRILSLYLNKSSINKSLDDLINQQLAQVAKDHIKHLLTKFLNLELDENSKESKVIGFSALFEILMILKRELSKEKNDEMKYSQFLYTLERANQEKLKMAIIQLKCVPCLNKFNTNFNLLNQTNSNSQLSSSCPNKNNSLMVNHANINRLLKQMSLIVSTELQQIAIDLVEKVVDDKPVKYIRLKEEFRNASSANVTTSNSSNNADTMTNASKNNTNTSNTVSKLVKQQQQQINNIMKSIPNSFSKKCELNQTQPIGIQNSKPIFNPKKDLQQFLSHDKKHDLSTTHQTYNRNNLYSERY